MFEKIRSGSVKPAKGKLLLAEPFLMDPNFKRSVILITEHGEKGTIGFILNKIVSKKINEILQDFPEIDTPLYLGGPVQTDSLHYLHKIENLEDAIKITEGIYWGGNFETLKMLINTKQVPSKDIRFFIGYSGWTSRQLSDEVKERSWIITKANSSEEIFSGDPKHLWGNIIKAMGEEYKIIANIPEDPSLN